MIPNTMKQNIYLLPVKLCYFIITLLHLAEGIFSTFSRFKLKLVSNLEITQNRCLKVNYVHKGSEYKFIKLKDIVSNIFFQYVM